jgi:outer membrane protein assembly factor BamB
VPGPLAAGPLGVAVVEETDDGRATVWLADPESGSAGSARWRCELTTAVKHQAVWNDDAVVVVDVAGRVIALDGRTGERRWDHQLGDPSERWCWAGAAVGDGLVVAGAAGHLAALDASSGAVRWARDDLSPDDWMMSRASPAVVGDVVVAGFGNRHTHLCALDAASGELMWRHAGPELAGSWSTPTVAGDAVVVATVHGWLRGVDLTTGEERWRAALDGPWPVARPAVVGDSLVVAVGSGGTVAAFALDDGSARWSVTLGPARRARRPYGREPGGHSAGPVVSDDGRHVVAAGASGRVVAVEAATGRVVWEHDVGSPVDTGPALVGDRVVLVTADNHLRFLVVQFHLDGG